MNASKENCEKASKIFESTLTGKYLENGDLKFIREFFTAAQRKLPSESAFPVKREKALSK